MSPTRSCARLVGGALLLAAVATACGDDAESMSTAACDRYAELQAGFFGDPSALGAAATAFGEAAPDSLEEDVGVVVAAFNSDDPSAMSTPEFAAANERVGAAVFDDCDSVVALDVSGIDYAFDGLPSSISSGRVAVRLANDTASGQPHELVILTGADGQAADELRDLPMEQLMQQARPVGLVFVEQPGAAATTLVDLEPGSYLVICTLPVAENGEQPDGDAPPTDTHAHHGMVTTLTVEA